MSLSPWLDRLNAIAPALTDAAVRGAVVLLMALMLTHFLRRRSAAARHLVWVGAIVVQLLLPVFATWGPTWDVTVPDVVASVSPVVIPAQHVTVAPQASVVLTSASETQVVSTPQPDLIAPVAAPVITGRQLLIALWALGAIIVLVRLAAGTAIVARLARRGNRVDDGNWLSLAQRVSVSLHIDRPLTLLRGTKLGVPVTWGIVYPVVLLPDDADSWPEERRRFVLVHEMAHVKRLDALTQLAGQLALALFWFDPLVWIANRRMQLEREHACDDYVIRHGTTPSMYAEELLSMVRSLGTSDRSSQPAFAALAMARRSEFEGRMLSILDPVLDRHPLSKWRAFVSVLAALVLVVPLAALHPYQRSTPPAPAAAPKAESSAVSSASKRATDEFPESFKISIMAGTHAEAPQPPRTPDSALSAPSGGTAPLAKSVEVSRSSSCDKIRLGGAREGTSTHISANENEGGPNIIDFLTFNSAHCASATIVGRLKYSNAEDDVLEMPFGSHAAFRSRTGVDDRELSLMPMQDGGIQRQYRHNGATAAWDDDARRWFAGYLPSVLMEAGLNVGPRVARWRSDGGVPNALSNIATMAGSSAKRSHYEQLLNGGAPLSGDDLDRVVRSAAENIQSSGDLAAILKRAAPNVKLSKQGILAIERALSAVASSGDKTSVLLAYGQTDDRDMLLGVMRTASSIPGSGDLARLLQVVASRYLTKGDRELEEAWFASVDHIPSSGDMRNVLMIALPYAAKSPAVAKRVLESTGRIASSGDRAAVLIASTWNGMLSTKALREQFLDIAGGVPSEGDRTRVLQAAASIIKQ
ncbi:MAG: M56 family metallopeptidase [Gemmatimonadaceae bacterium]